MTYNEYIERLKMIWTGREVRFLGETYTVMDVDYNGALLINKPDQFKATTAILPSMLDDYRASSAYR